MSDDVLRELVTRLATDEAFASAVRADPTVLSNYDLTDDERAEVSGLTADIPSTASALGARQSKSSLFFMGAIQHHEVSSHVDLGSHDSSPVVHHAPDHTHDAGVGDTKDTTHDGGVGDTKGTDHAGGSLGDTKGTDQHDGGLGESKGTEHASGSLGDTKGADQHDGGVGDTKGTDQHDGGLSESKGADHAGGAGDDKGVGADKSAEHASGDKGLGDDKALGADKSAEHASGDKGLGDDKALGADKSAEHLTVKTGGGDSAIWLKGPDPTAFKILGEAPVQAPVPHEVVPGGLTVHDGPISGTPHVASGAPISHPEHSPGTDQHGVGDPKLDTHTVKLGGLRGYMGQKVVPPEDPGPTLK